MRRSALGRARDAARAKERRLLREQLLERSGGACEVRFSEFCTGVGQAPHHRKKRSQGGRDTLENCLWCCHICNTAIEDEPLRAYAAGLVIKSWEGPPLEQWRRP